MKYHVFFRTRKGGGGIRYEISKAEIGGMIYTVPPLWLYIARSESGTDFAEKWSKDKERFRKDSNGERRVKRGTCCDWG